MIHSGVIACPCLTIPRSIALFWNTCGPVFILWTLNTEFSFGVRERNISRLPLSLRPRRFLPGFSFPTASRWHGWSLRNRQRAGDSSAGWPRPVLREPSLGRKSGHQVALRFRSVPIRKRDGGHCGSRGRFRRESSRRVCRRCAADGIFWWNLGMRWRYRKIRHGTRRKSVRREYGGRR